MKKKIVLVFSFALLASLMLLVPASLGESSRKIPVVFSRLDAFYNPGTFWTTDGGTYHAREISIGFDAYSVTGVGVYLTGSESDSGVGNLNLKNGVGHITYQLYIRISRWNL